MDVSVMGTEPPNADSWFDLGKLHYGRGDFQEAVVKLEKASELYLTQKGFLGYLKCQNILLRIYSEMEDFDNLNKIKDRLQDQIIKNGIEPNSKMYYTLGVSALYKNQSDISLEYFQKALAIALAADEKEDIAYAIYGLAAVYTYLGKYQDALREIYNLQVFFEVLQLSDLVLSTKILNARILCNLNKYEQATEIFWECYDLLRHEKNLYLFLELLYAMGSTARKQGDVSLARMYLRLAKRLVDPICLKGLARSIDEELSELGVHSSNEYDLTLDGGTNAVYEKKRGQIDFRNQFVLLDLLKLFMSNPGVVFSKEELVEKIWKQSYDPAIHDNKVYVTIKRLRKMIEPDFDKPKYIFRAKDGYFLSKSNKIHIEKARSEAIL